MNILPKRIIYFVIGGFMLLVLNSCKEKTAPVIDALSFSSLSDTGVVLSVNINNDGNEDITERGVCYTTNPNPTITNTRKIVSGTVGTMSVTISDLVSSTTYYVRAYATNSKGTTYSNEVTFTTHVSRKYLMAYYPFNGNANDESGKGNNGIVYGAVLSSDKDDNANSAYLFDGVDDFIEIQANKTINPSDEISLVAWVYPTLNGNNFDHIFTVTFNANYPPYSSYNVCKLNDKMSFWLTTGETPSEDDIECINNMIANNWYHVACTYDGSTMKLYINGGLEDSKAKTGKIQYKDASLKFGHAVKDQFMTGKLDEMRIYSKALTEKEVKQLYQFNE